MGASMRERQRLHGTFRGCRYEKRPDTPSRPANMRPLREFDEFLRRAVPGHFRNRLEALMIDRRLVEQIDDPSTDAPTMQIHAHDRADPNVLTDLVRDRIVE